MRISNVTEQGTDEWKSLRLGIPTASEFSKIVTSQGKRSTQVQGYIDELIAERLTGQTKMEWTNEIMLRGNELEDQARANYELDMAASISQIDFAMHDDLDCGFSPDGIIGSIDNPEGLLEIKSPLQNTLVSYHRGGKMPSTYIPQVQAQLWMSQASYVDFYAYHPSIKPFLIRVEPDLKLHKLMEEIVREMLDVINEMTEKLKND
jgi:hypothetical protein